MNVELKPRRDLFPVPAPAPANDNAERRRESEPRRRAVIYKPAKSAMTSGRAATKRWLLEYEPQSAPFIEPLMGWTGSADPMAQMRLTFPSREAALAYAQRHGLDYEVREPTEWVKAQVRANNLIAAGAVLVHLPRETQSSFLALTLTAEPEIAPIPKTDVVLETHPEPQSARPSVPTAKQRTSEPSKAGQQLSPEQVSLLLARGDELVKRADVVSGRLFYDRAADAGDAQAALRFAWGQAMTRPFSPRQALEAFAAIPRSRLIGTNVHATLVLGKQRLCSKASVFIDASAAQPSPAVRKCANA